jgi:two-component system, OmpR family, sensor histidine kinase VicK
MICSSVKEGNPPRQEQQIISKISSLVDLYQFPFRILWNQAISADLRIKEIEEGIPQEKTEIVRGTENILRSQVEGLSKTKLSLDACCDRTFPASLVLNKEVWDMCSIFYSRGITTRIITEITQYNLEYCAKMATRMNLRHLDTVSGNFSITDGKEYRGTAAMREGQPPTEGIFSNASVFVKEQTYLFETLWNKSIPAKQRIREIKEGAKREFVESIRDPVEIQRTGHELIISAKEEILIMFSSAIAFHHQESSSGILLKLKDELRSSALLREVRIRILVPMDDKIRNETAKELKVIGINIRNYRKNALLRSELTTLLVDNTYVLSMELEGNPAERIEEVTGLATYSNSESAFLTYASIFETLWMQRQ